ncbi:hypothetical protein VIN01S_35010 [Vibrio inusitatus NBRC 102082]|uniref:TehB/YeaR-like domain-containing protein n=1 Tax=Vibrio inusitatus NBRC 102082 TaxID=1219070 RepID=A0A4Y3HZW4_9VIBR|nr:DUF1971 domain-containing protein [Vibrio inusitatus]GEA52697.1 hypothetical protein VIN01S_35010 [Vibrio inusitatus NBRC 102082]
MTIPHDFINYKKTDIFSKEQIPKMFLFEHNTKAGVYGKINVLTGTLKFTGFTERRGDVENETLINAGECLISPPEYWHKVEFMTDDTQFFVEFYAQKDSEIVIKNLSERN